MRVIRKVTLLGNCDDSQEAVLKWGVLAFHVMCVVCQVVEPFLLGPVHTLSGLKKHGWVGFSEMHL